MDKFRQYKTMTIKLTLTAYIEAIAVAEQFNLDFGSKHHRRFIAAILDLYRVTDRAEIAVLHDSEQVADVLAAVEEFEELAYSRSTEDQDHINWRCALVDCVLEDAVSDLTRFRTLNFVQKSSAAETVRGGAHAIRQLPANTDK